MKRLSLIGVLLVLFTASCKKYYTCTCYYNGSAVYVANSLEKKRKDDVKDFCSARERDYKNSDPTADVHCDVDKTKK